MTTLEYVLVLVAGILSLTCYEGKQLTATDYEQNIETSGYGYSIWMPYLSYMFETWSIKTKDSMNTIEVEIEYDIEYCQACMCDSLQIYDGLNNAATSLGKFCGAATDNTISSSGRDMYVVFRSDHLLEARGFRLKYKQVQGKKSIWIIVGIVLAVVIIIASVCLIMFVCCNCKTRENMIHIRFNYEHQPQPRVWMTRAPQQHFQVVHAQIGPPPAYQEIQHQNPQVPAMQDTDRENLPDAFDIVGVGSRPPRQDQKT